VGRYSPICRHLVDWIGICLNVVIISPTIESIGRKEALYYQENPIQEPDFFVDSLESVVFWRKELLNMANEGEGSNLKEPVTFEFLSKNQMAWFK
jgi:hypothetical protein